MIMKYASIIMDTDRKIITYPKKMTVAQFHMALLQLRRIHMEARKYTYPIKRYHDNATYACEDWRLKCGPRGVPGRVMYDPGEKRFIHPDRLQLLLSLEDEAVRKRDKKG